MKLINSVGPNPQVVRMFAAEKGLKLAMEQIDLMGGENRQGPFLAKNPAGQSPALELDDGSYLSEITAICEYLDEKFPQPSLMGGTPEERAETRMWTRRIDLNIFEPLANGFRFAEGLPLFQSRITVLPEAADGLKRIARERLEWLNGLMGERQFVCGDRISLADCLLYCFLTFGKSVGQPVDPSLSWVNAWLARMDARPSAKA
jgi:glutathione S-transferase